MNTDARFIRPLTVISAASLLALASCSKEEQPPADTVSPTNQTAPSQSAGNDMASQLPETPQETGAAGEPATAGLTWTVPTGWGSVPAEGMMRQAQYSAPAPEGSSGEAGECVVYYFGPEGQGGTVEANVSRWSQQVLDEQGAPSEPASMEFDSNDLHITTVAYVGTYQSGMPGGPTTPMPGWMLLGAVIEGGPQGNVFVKMTGPVETVDANREAWEMMVRSFRATE